jgi:glutaredoxin
VVCPVCTKILKALFEEGVEGMEVEVSATVGELREA